MPSWFPRLRKSRPRDADMRAMPARAIAPTSVPAGTVVYAIGDVHGRLDLLQRLEAQIVAHPANSGTDRRLIVCLGDYVDRGDDVYGVIEHLRGEPPASFERICLIGNHEAYLLRFLEDSAVAPAWMANGGRETLWSYGIAPPDRPSDPDEAAEVQAALLDRMPASHIAFLRSLALSHREGDYLFVHAGVRPGVPLEYQDPEDLIWIRDEFLEDQRDFGAVVVHGHSIRREPENFANRIGVDTGAYASGSLTCVVLKGTERRFLSTKSSIRS